MVHKGVSLQHVTLLVDLCAKPTSSSLPCACCLLVAAYCIERSGTSLIAVQEGLQRASCIEPELLRPELVAQSVLLPALRKIGQLIASCMHEAWADTNSGGHKAAVLARQRLADGTPVILLQQALAASCVLHRHPEL